MNYRFKSVRKTCLWVALPGLVLLWLAACSSEIITYQELSDAATVETGTYILTVKHSGMVLDLPNSNPQAGVQLWQYPRNNSTAQQWKIEAVDGDWVKITSVVNGYALSVPYRTPRDGAKVSLEPYSTNLIAKQWLLVTGRGGYEIINRSSGGRLEVSGAATTQGALVNTRARTATDNQKWSLEKVGGTPPPSNYQQNLALITNASVRNRNLDGSSYRNTPMASIPSGSTSPLLGPRSDYLQNAGGNPENDFPVTGVGTFRTSCEFSHFAYDDPLLYPGQPGAAHLHMFFGNTNVNAYSTYQTLRDSGSGTCNGMELNRTGYWAPALFDAGGNVRIPERIIVYYKGYGQANGESETYPAGAAMITKRGAQDVHETPTNQGGTKGIYEQLTFQCTDQYRSTPREPFGNTIPVCTPRANRAVLEMHIKFPNCWNRQDPSKPANWGLSTTSDWFTSDCGDRATFPNIEYLIAYPLEPGESTAGWYISSDVDPTSRKLTVARGTSSHGDWWGAWNPAINKQWIDNCVNFKDDTQPHGCGFGYLTNGGPTENTPLPGPALKYRQQYTGPIKVAATTLYKELCPGGRTITRATEAAYCRPPTTTANAHLHH
jgi:Domain of unknown function (DUF1996)/Ricin-type beta-trefoil lectin domain-like